MRVYLDHNATTPLAPEAREAMLPWLGRAANASSVHAEGRAAREAVERAREAVAAALGVTSREIVLTSGATEANNAVLRGFGGVRRHVVTTAAEHPSVLDPVRGAATLVPVDGLGRVDPVAVRAALREDTGLCSILLANNETGVVQDVAAIAAECRARGVLVHVDAAQGLGRLPIDLAGIDYATFSAHKVHGPIGAGALFVRRGAGLDPFVRGGHQERGRRGGTENVAAIAGFGAACGRVPAMLAAIPRVAALRDRLEAGLGGLRNGDPAHCLPNTLNVAFDGVDAEALLAALDLAGVAASAGSACTAGSLEPSHVLLAMGISDARARSSLRFSLGVGTTEADIDTAIAATRDALQRLRR